MQIIEIRPLENGAHRNQKGDFTKIPDGWALLPDNLPAENFPFGEIEVSEVRGIKVVTQWTPTEAPEEPEIVVPYEPSASEILNAMLGVSE